MHLLALVLGVLLIGATDKDERRLEPGDTLASLCERQYGSEHYAQLLLLHNHLEPTSVLLAGQRLSLPPLTKLVEQEGFDATVQVAAAEVASAHEALFSVTATLWQSHALPAAVVDTLLKAEVLLRSAASRLTSLRSEGKQLPKAAIGQLTQAASLVHALSAGQFGPNAYNLADAHRRLAYGLTYLVQWKRAGYR